MSGGEQGGRKLLWSVVWALKQVRGSSSRSQSSLRRHSWTSRVTLGGEGWEGWKNWRLWNASKNQNPLSHSPSLGHPFLGPCLQKTMSALLGGHGWSSLRSCFPRPPSSTHCCSVWMAPLTAAAGTQGLCHIPHNISDSSWPQKYVTGLKPSQNVVFSPPPAHDHPAFVNFHVKCHFPRGLPGPPSLTRLMFPCSLIFLHDASSTHLLLTCLKFLEDKYSAGTFSCVKVCLAYRRCSVNVSPIIFKQTFIEYHKVIF